MRKTLTFGGVPVEIEANLGTASFFQEFTGMNILDEQRHVGGNEEDRNQGYTNNYC